MPETWSWIDGDGISTAMSNFTQGVEVLEGVTGRYMPPIRRTRDTVAGQSGSRLRDVKHDLRTTSVPILIRGASEAQRATLLQDWAARFDPTRGTGALDVTNNNGDRRLLRCIYSAGLEVIEDASNRYPGCQAAVLVFEADDPYWYDIGPSSQLFSSTSTVPLWFNAGTSKNILPITLGASAVLGGAVINVDSDVNVYPIWTVTGPGSALVVRNVTTGREFIWNGTLTGGQTLTIDTRPGVGTVIRQDGANEFSFLTEWDLWPLAPGNNSINVNMSGTSGASSIRADWTNAHLTP